MMNKDTLFEIEILVIEDDETLNFLIQKRLKRHNFKITGFFSGEDALQFLTHNNKNYLLLLDYKLPDYKADDFIRELHKYKGDIYYVIMTGYTDINNIITMMKMGALDYFIKDSQFLELLPSKLEKVNNEIRKNIILQQSQYEIIRSEKKFRNIFEASPMGMLMYEINDLNELVLIDTNISSEKILKMDTSKYIGHTFYQNFPGLKKTGLHEQFIEVATKGNIYYTDDLYYEDDHINGYFEFYAFQTSRNKIVVSFIDISDRKEAEIAIQKNTRDIEFLHDVILSGNNAENLSIFLDYILKSCLELFNFETGSIYLIDRGSKIANLYSSNELLAEVSSLDEELDITSEPYKAILCEGKSFFIDHYEEHKLFTGYKEVSSIAIIPLIASNTVIGMLTLIVINKNHNFQDDEVKLLRTIGNETGSIIAKMLSEEALLKKTKYLETSNQVLNFLQTSKTQTGISTIIRDHLDLHTCIIGLIDKNKRGFISEISSKYPDNLIAFIKNSTFNTDETSFFAKLTKNLHETIVFDPEELMGVLKTHTVFPEEMMSDIDINDIGDLLLVPLHSSESILHNHIGFIILIKNYENMFNTDEIKLAENLAFKIGSTIEIHKLAYNDDLTKLPNLRMLKKYFYDFKVKEKDFALFIVNINKFSKVIASRGDEIGDKCVIQIATRLQEICINNDQETILFRPSHGKASFSILMLTNDDNKIKQLSEEIINVFKKPIYVSGLLIDLTTNLGVYISDEMDDHRSVLKLCKTALYEAKKVAPNTYALYTKDMSENIYQQLILEKDIRDALNQRKFFPHYQPKIDINGEVVGHEALARWIDGDKIKMPGIFINKIEEMGLINKLFYLMLENICEDYNKYTDKIKELSINLSPRQFNDNNLIANVKSILDNASLDPTVLKLELIETALIDKKNIDIINKFYDMGISVSIDDFGTGFAKYETLLHLFKEKIVEELKIAHVFVRELDSYENTIFITSITQMAEKFNVSVVIEGVEDITQYFILKGISQNIVIQGWLFSKALDPDEIFSLDDDHFVKKLKALNKPRLM